MSLPSAKASGSRRSSAVRVRLHASEPRKRGTPTDSGCVETHATPVLCAWLAWAVAFVGLGLACVGSAADLPSVVEMSTNRPPCCRELKPQALASDRSLYQLDSVWTSDVGRKIPLRVLKGRPQVVALFFTQCEFACPIIVHDLKRIQEALPPAVRDQVDFVLVSLDPERDKPAVLAKYRKQQHLGTDHWTLLTGPADDVRELAALLGVNYRKDDRGQFAHSNLISILNGEGEVIHQQVGLNKEPHEAVDALCKCAETQSSATRK